jgi:hypothetical protein
MRASSLYEHNAFLASVHSLIKRFIGRQAVVLEAIRDLRPDWIIRAEGRISKEFNKSGWQKFVLKYARSPQLGRWGTNNEWEYFLHGVGCRMKHTITGELLDWNLGSLREFHKWVFIYYVQWSIEEAEDKDVLVIQLKLKDEAESKTLEKMLIEALNQLTDAGIVKPNEWGNKYLLISE